jgi:hypothetical protein
MNSPLFITPRRFSQFHSSLHVHCIPRQKIRVRPHVFYLLVYGTADLEFWDIRKKLKLRFQKRIKKTTPENTSRIRFFHLKVKMQHDDSKCPKFSSAVEIEYKRLTYKDTIVTSKKVTKPNPFELHHFSHFSQFYFLFFSDHPTIIFWWPVQ